MSKTRIFLSSTCYDLAAVREHLRECILSLGHEPLLSEYPSFPVRPDETTLATCKKNIREGSDILVLIIGGRRGSLDEETGKSITNVEYETARQAGVPCFVFINRSVNTLLSVWKKNPDADFTPDVDCPEVFEFIERVRAENVWTFTFEKTAEIKDSLTHQLSVLLKDLLNRSKGGSLEPVRGFAGESEEAQRLARDKPDYWEFLLGAELLDCRLQDIRRRFDRVKDNRTHRFSQTAHDQKTFCDWIATGMQDLSALVDAINRQLPIIGTCFGKPGEAGDPYEIKRTINEFSELCNQLVEWEEKVASTHAPDGFEKLKNTLRGMTVLIVEEMELLPVKLREPFANGAEPEGTIRIDLSLEAPPMDDFNKELKRVGRKMNWGF